jgi:hypothetical protein
MFRWPRLRLKRSGVVPIVGERKATGVPEHVRVRLKAELGLDTCALDHAGETGSRERRAPLGGEHEGRLGFLFALKPTHGSQFVPHDRMSAGSALLDPGTFSMAAANSI